MDNFEYKYAEAFKTIDIVEYLPKSVVIKSILRKTTGSISALSFDSGEVLVGKKSPHTSRTKSGASMVSHASSQSTHLVHTLQRPSSCVPMKT